MLWSEIGLQLWKILDAEFYILHGKQVARMSKFQPKSLGFMN
jgi:hypothetical protein